MTIMIREYQDTDYQVCRSLYGELAQHHSVIYEDADIAGEDPGRGFDEYIKLPYRQGIWLAVSEKEVVGFAGLLDAPGEEGVVNIEPVVITVRTRNKGIGTKLIEHAVNEARKRGFHFVSIYPVLRNEKAFDLYVRLGFNKIGAIELVQDLSLNPTRKWKSGIRIHSKELMY